MSPAPIRNVLLACAMLVATTLAAQTPAPVAPAPYDPLPRIDASKALSGQGLVDALRRGGYVIYMRHAKYGKVTEQCTEPNLVPEGEAEAKKVGAALRERKIPFGSVRASQLCRAIETARLLEVGPVESTADLNPAKKEDGAAHAVRNKLLAVPPKPGTNTLLVSHVQNANDPKDELSATLCELVVFKPDGRGGAEAVARIRPEDWEKLPK
jgi:phosphohistidine phosphatase SixA